MLQGMTGQISATSFKSNSNAITPIVQSARGGLRISRIESAD